MRSNFRLLSKAFVVFFLFTFLTACSEEEQKKVELPPRHIKYMTLNNQALGQARVIAGVLAPTVKSNLAFEVAGQIQKINFSVGQTIKKGDVLAQLDSKTYELNVKSAEGNLNSAKATLSDAEKKFEQQRRLYEKGFTTKTDFDSAEATLATSKSNVSIRQSELEIAKRDLVKTKLIAPFSGSISQKQAEVFEEVTVGKTIAVLNTVGDFEVDVSVPDSFINKIKVSDPVEVKITIAERQVPLKGYVKDISTQAGDANAYPVKIWLTSASNKVKELRSGMSAEVTFRFATNTGAETFFVPTAAVITSGEHHKSYVFVYNAGQKYVERRNVQVVNIRNNDLMIQGNVKSGDILAVAGLSFLHDKMPVRLLGQK